MEGGLKMFTENLSERGQKTVERTLDRLDIAEEHMQRRERLIDQWNSEETKGFFFSAPEWDRDARSNPIFKPRTFLIAGIGFIAAGIPFLLMLPFLLERASRREKLSSQIYREERLMKSILPVPLDEDDYRKICRTPRGRPLALEGIIFDNSYIKKGVQL